MPVSWAINVVPHMNVQAKALRREIDLDIDDGTYIYIANL
tara:strand:+ start:811 stop:930 length:120 start_codon:yes stop_codon:yes gene_type:complete